jgi:hypothetical protein
MGELVAPPFLRPPGRSAKRGGWVIQQAQVGVLSDSGIFGFAERPAWRRPGDAPLQLKKKEHHG